MPTKTLLKGKNKAQLDGRRLVQRSGRGEEIDPDEVAPILGLRGWSYDDFESKVVALEECLADEVAFHSKGYSEKIAELLTLQTEAQSIRKVLDAEQAELNKRFVALRAMEERVNHHHSLRAAQQNQESLMLNKRRKLLGTTDLEAFPVID